MSKLVSILMPTRGPHESLRKAIKSIKDNCSNLDDIEILLKVDDDDADRFFIAEELTNGCGGFVIAPRRDGYNSMGLHVQDLVKVADSRWSWLFDDDALIEGSWYHQLKSLTCDINPNHAVNSQYYQLGGSTYENGKEGGCVGIIIPTEIAREIPPVSPVDQVWLDHIKGKGWHCKQMAGTTYHHCGRAR